MISSILLHRSMPRSLKPEADRILYDGKIVDVKDDQMEQTHDDYFIMMNPRYTNKGLVGNRESKNQLSVMA